MFNLSFTDKVAIKAVLLTIIALVAIPYYFIAGGTLLGFVLIQLISRSIALFTPVAYHRWLCHNSFQPTMFGKILMSFAMVTSAFGDPLHNVVAHRLHHPHADTDKDPHSPHHVSFWALWLGQYRIQEGGLRPPKDFFRNPVAVFVHNHYWKLFWLFNILLFLVVDLKTALVYCPVNFVYGWTLNTIVNYYGHVDPTTGVIQPRNLGKVLTYLTAGEGLHGNHHASPASVDFSSKDRKDPMVKLVNLLTTKTG